MQQIEIPANVKLIQKILQAEGFQAFVYGACIRDSLLGLKPINWDITTNALPSDIVTIFDDHQGFSAVPALHEYSTVSLIYMGESYNITTYRTGTEHRFASNIDEELKHIDFTINAVAYNERVGWVDLLNGISDIKDKIIRCAGDPGDSIQKDTSRILRAVRFEIQLGFAMEDSLAGAIKAFANPTAFRGSEKVCNELTQILLSSQPSRGIRRLLELGILEQIIPELSLTVGFNTHSSFHDKDVFEHTMAVLDHCKPNLALRLAALLHDIDKPNCFTIDTFGEGHCYGHASSGSQTACEILTRLNFDRKTIKAVAALIKEHMNSYENVSELSIRRLIRRVGPNNIDNLFELQLADIKGSGLSGRDSVRIDSVRNHCWEVLSRREPLTTHDLDISGYDLMPFYSTGKEIGDALEYLLDRVVDNPALNHKTQLLTILKARQEAGTASV